jgi:hypothetical protein
MVPSWETLAAPPGTALETVPTGITSSPRRWFTRARFDHRPHRNVSCLDCHAGVQQSTSTADLSLPDLTGGSASRPSARSCVDCHHAGTGGAAATCVTCHDYHNSRLEAAPDGHRGLWNALEAGKTSTPETPVEEVDVSKSEEPPQPALKPFATPATQPAPVPAPGGPDLPPPPPAPDLPAPPAPDLPSPDLPPPPP